MSGNAVKHIAHIGIAVKRIKDTISFYTDDLGLELEKIIMMESEGVKIAFVKIGETRFELMEPLHEESAIYNFIKTKGEGLHHIALEVDHIDQRIKYLKRRGLKLIDNHKKQGAENTDVAFLHPKTTHGVLYELCEHHNKY